MSILCAIWKRVPCLENLPEISLVLVVAEFRCNRRDHRRLNRHTEKGGRDCLPSDDSEMGGASTSTPSRNDSSLNPWQQLSAAESITLPSLVSADICCTAE